MVNTELLLGYIVQSGMAITTISQKLSLSEAAFMKRVANIEEFIVSEINMLCDILEIPAQNAIHVFFS